MFAIPKRRRALGRTAACAGLVLGAMGFGTGLAAAAPPRPVPADIPFVPTFPDPSSMSPMMGSPIGSASGVGGLLPLLTDTIKLFSGGGDPNALVGNSQNLLNDAGALFGAPVGMPSIGSLVPQGAVPNGAPVAPLAPPAPIAPFGPIA